MGKGTSNAGKVSGVQRQIKVSITNALKSEKYYSKSKGDFVSYETVAKELKSGVHDAKVGEEVAIAEWFSLDLPSYAIQPSYVTIVGESASKKAWKVDVSTESVSGEHDLYYTKYIPKKAALSESQQKKEWFDETTKKVTGTIKYEYLQKFAESRVKGRVKGLKKENIIKKLKEAGYDYDYNTGTVKRIRR